MGNQEEEEEKKEGRIESTVGEICRQGWVGVALCTTRVAAAAAKVARPHQNHRDAGKEQRVSESWRKRKRGTVNRKKHTKKKLIFQTGD